MIRHLYVHTPFCAKVCPYCAFHVHLGGATEQRAFVDALQREWTAAAQEFSLAPATVYFGGGTPSLLAPDLFTRMAQPLQGVRQDIEEFTLEVNPATVTDAKAAAWRAAGVNRISLGVQSFDPVMLLLLGRQHRADDVAQTCALLRDHGFTNLNLDLMFALPGQSEAKWEETVRRALDCKPQHISAYALTYEEDTPFFERLHGGEWRQDEEREIAMFERTRAMLAGAGMTGYEISNFALPGCESRHNLAYWRGADYLGLGPSACSTVGDRRWRNAPDTAAYVERLRRGDSIRVEEETIDPATRARERIMFGLRMREGVALSAFARDEQRLRELEGDGLLQQYNAHVRLTERGQLVADSVAAMFV